MFDMGDGGLVCSKEISRGFRLMILPGNQGWKINFGCYDEQDSW